MSLVSTFSPQSNILRPPSILVQGPVGEPSVRNGDITGAAIAMVGNPNVTRFIVSVGRVHARLTLQDAEGGLRLLAYGLNSQEADEVFKTAQEDHLIAELFNMSYGPCVLSNHLSALVESMFGRQEYQPWYILKGRCIRVLESYESKFEITEYGLYDQYECTYDMDKTFEYQMLKEVLKQLDAIKPHISGHSRSLSAVAVDLPNV